MKYCLVDSRISEVELKELYKLGVEPLLCPKCDNLYDAISCHPDIQVFVLNQNNIIVHNQINKDLLEKLHGLGKKIHFSKKILSNKYPHDIILNCFILGDLFIHNIKYTDEKIINLLPDNIKKINVKQGYSKCSTAIVNDKAVITTDPSIAKALSYEKVDVLYLPPGDIILEGMNYGFIGGTCGLLNKNNIAFYGNLDKYMYGNEVKSFLKKYKINWHCLADSRLVDRGSILML
ncbi:MAG: hypothetical protein GX206_01185 [Clostridiales bacterium]|nr:hypothetical protein [Clostridiales bacterium]